MPKELLNWAKAGRYFDDHGYGTISAETISEAEFLIGKFLTVSA